MVQVPFWPLSGHFGGVGPHERLVIGYMEGENEEELKTKTIPKHSEAKKSPLDTRYTHGIQDIHIVLLFLQVNFICFLDACKSWWIQHNALGCSH